MIWPNMIEAQYKKNAKHSSKNKKHEIFWYKTKKNKLKKRKKRKKFFNIKTKTNFESRKTQKIVFE